MRAPSEAKLAEMLKQLTAGGARTLMRHDGRQLRVYRGKVEITPAGEPWCISGTPSIVRNLPTR